jgi:hypothetical protein
VNFGANPGVKEPLIGHCYLLRTMVTRVGSRRHQRTTDIDPSTMPMDDNAALLTGEASLGARSTLSGSLQRDVARFLATPANGELLPVLAACVRHSRPITTILAHGECEVCLTLDPRMQMFACDLDLLALEEAQFRALSLQCVDDAIDLDALARSARAGRLAKLLWRVAMEGNRDDILPEIGGPATYRISGGFRRGLVSLPQSLETVVTRLNGPPASLAELQQIAGNGPLIQRLLNALYLDSALIVTRAGPRRPRNLASLL